jgi:hypothetical protein
MKNTDAVGGLLHQFAREYRRVTDSGDVDSGTTEARGVRADSDSEAKASETGYLLEALLWLRESRCTS